MKWLTTRRAIGSIGLVLVGVAISQLDGKHTIAYLAGWLVGIGTCSLWTMLSDATN